MSDDTSKLLNACVEYRAMVDKLECENAALKQRILDDNKAYGCELRDPSGTIWDHAKRLHEENAALREELEYTIKAGAKREADLLVMLGKEAQP